jgi:hypothetical protein
LIEGASVIADIALRQSASRDEAPKPRLRTEMESDLISASLNLRDARNEV